MSDIKQRQQAHHLATSVDPYSNIKSNDLRNGNSVDKSRAIGSAMTVFDKMHHLPPRIDQFGFNVEPKGQYIKERGRNILLDNTVTAPTWWGENGSAPKRTLTDMQARRRKDNIPDISYDLDGDGIVGNRDYVLAKMFDKDKDGKLNAEETKSAHKAINNVSIFLGYFFYFYD